MKTRTARFAWGSVLVLGAASAMVPALLPNLSSLFAGWTRWGHEAPVVSFSDPDRASATPTPAEPVATPASIGSPARLELTATVTDPDDTRAAVVIDGAVWIASGGGLLHVNPSIPGSSRWWTTADGLPDHRLTAIARWADGVVVGTEGGSIIHLGLPDPSGDRETLLDLRSVVSLGTSRISDLAVDDGLLWVATWGEGVFVGDPADPAGFRALGPARGLRARRITSLARLDGELIAGTAGAGLWVRSDDGGSRLFVARGGLISDFILTTERVGDRVVLGGPGGISRYRRGVLQTFPGGERLPGGVVRAIADDDGTAVLALSGGRTGRLGSTDTTPLPPAPDGLGPWNGVAGAEARWLLPVDGTLIAGTARGLLIDEGDGFAWLTHDGPGGNDLTSVAALDGQLLVGTWDLGAWLAGDGAWEALPTPSAEVNDVALTADGAWLGTSGGLSRVDDDGVRTFGVLHGLAHEHVGALAVDGARIVVGTTSGVQRFDGVGFTALGGDDAAPLRNVYSVALAGDRVWAGTLEGLWSLGASDAEQYRYESGELPDSWVNGVAVASDGSIWAGTYDQGIARGRADGWSTFGEVDGLPSGWVNPDAILALDDGTVLFGTMGGGLLRLTADGLLDSWSTADGLAGDDVTGLARDGDLVWVATRSGLSRLEISHDRS